MPIFFFVISLMIPSFGGPVNITIDAHTMDGCKKLHRVARIQMNELYMKYDITDCKLKVLDFQRP